MGSSGDVLVNGFLRKVNHMTGEEGFAMDLEVGLISLEHAIEPRQELLGTVVRVKDHRNAILRSDTADVVSSSGRTGDRSLLAIIAHTLERSQYFRSHNSESIDDQYKN